MNPFNKKLRKELKSLNVGESTFFPWAILEAGGNADRPEQPAYCGINDRVYYMEPTDAGLRITRHEGELLRGIAQHVLVTDTVVKVQVPFVTNDPSALALCYDKSREHQGFCELTAPLMEAMDGSLKKFFKATIIDDEILIDFDSEVPYQDW